MTACMVCDNDNSKFMMQISLDGKTYTFDCFECAIYKLAPFCNHCGCTIIGHSITCHGQIFCCTYCAKQAGLINDKEQV